MKITELILALIFLIGFGVCVSNAQQGVVSAGGEATGSGGSMSFSTGQTDFLYFSSEAGSIQFGLQQVFFFDDDDDPDPGVPLTVQLISDDIFQGEEQCFDATQTIILAGGNNTFIVEDETGVDLIAGYSILMLPGTTVKLGGYMHALITSPDGPFCDVAEPIVASLQIEPPHGSTYQEPLFTTEKEKADKTFFRVYPNPTAGDFTVELLNPDIVGQAISIEIISMRGELVYRINQISHFQHQLSLQEHQPGLYVVRVQNSDHFGIERIIKH